MEDNSVPVTSSDDNLESYLVEVMESNNEVNQNIEDVGDDLEQVTEGLENLLKVMEAEKKENQDQKEIQSSMRKTDLEFRDQILEQLNGSDGTDNDLLSEISVKLDHLVENSYVNKTTDTVIMLYGFIIIPAILILIAFGKLFRPFT